MNLAASLKNRSLLPSRWFVFRRRWATPVMDPNGDHELHRWLPSLFLHTTKPSHVLSVVLSAHSDASQSYWSRSLPLSLSPSASSSKEYLDDEAIVRCPNKDQRYRPPPTVKNVFF
ncbi:hypothetical protein CsatB_003609 [Cannabis sativa]